jgi:putative membrane protein
MRMTEKIAKTILTVSLGSAIAFGQAANAPKPQSSTQGHGNHSADHGMSSNKGAGVLVGKPDEEFMMKAAQGGLMEVEAARLAQEKASSTEIKEFARKLEQDHTKANDQLKQLAAQKNVQLPTDMGQHAATVEKIRNLSGDQFDKAFMKMQVQHHKKDVNEFQKETTRAMDSDVKTFASATLPTLQEHLKQAQDLEGSTRGRKASSSSSSSQGATSSSSQGSTSSSSQGGSTGSSSTAPAGKK